MKSINVPGFATDETLTGEFRISFFMYSPVLDKGDFKEAFVYDHGILAPTGALEGTLSVCLSVWFCSAESMLIRELAHQKACSSHQRVYLILI